MDNVRVYRNDLISYDKRLYFDKLQNAWIVTNDELISLISKNEIFSSNRIDKKLATSNISLELRKKLLDFYSTWIMYKDGIDHSTTRRDSTSPISELTKNISKLEIRELLSEKIEKINIIEDDVIDLSELSRNIAKEIMSRLFGINLIDYKKIFQISHPLTSIMYENTISEENAIAAVNAIEELALYLEELVSINTVSNTSVIGRLISDENFPTGLVINILIDGQDPLESLINSIIFKWANGSLTDFKTDIQNIMKYWAPFTSLSRICNEDILLEGEHIACGDRVLCIIAKNDKLDPLACKKNIAFGSGIHRCMGEGLTIKVSRIIYDFLMENESPFSLLKYETSKSFGYFTFTKILATERKTL